MFACTRIYSDTTNPAWTSWAVRRGALDHVGYKQIVRLIRGWVAQVVNRISDPGAGARFC